MEVVAHKSTGIRTVFSTLDALNIAYEIEKTFPDLRSTTSTAFALLRVDIWISVLNLGIEFDGEQHHTPISWGSANLLLSYLGTLLRDQDKNEWFRKKQYSLLRIPAEEQCKIPEIILGIIQYLQTPDSAPIIIDVYEEWRKGKLEYVQ